MKERRGMGPCLPCGSLERAITKEAEVTPEEKRKKQREYMREYRKRHPEKNREARRRYAERHPERVLDAGRKFEASGKRDMKKKYETNKAWRDRNPERVKEIGLAYRRAHRDEAAAQSTEWRRKMVLAVKLYLGAVCRCCGEKELELLTVDHINDDGYVRRREKGYGGPHSYYMEIKRAFDSDDAEAVAKVKSKYQLFCYNCNNSKKNGGECVHTREPYWTHPEWPYEGVLPRAC